MSLSPGHIVLFTVPGKAASPRVELGMVMTVWRGLKNPRPYAGDVQVASCVAFRVVELQMEDKEPMPLLAIFS